MLNISEKGKFIDIKNLPSTFEIPIENIFDYKKTIATTSDQKTDETNSEQKKKPFTFEELDLNESSGAIKFNSEGNSLLININGPRECKYRDKTKNECCIVEIYSKFNNETKKEKSKNFNALIQSFCESVIFTTEYPKCQINIAINILSVSNETSLLCSVFNGIMLCLALSGISIKIFSLSSYYLNAACNLRIILSFDAHNLKEILSINTNKPLKKEEYKNIITKSQEEVRELFDYYRKIMVKKVV